MLTTYYNLQLTRPTADGHDHSPVVWMIRQLMEEAPAVGTWVTINAQDEEWENFDIQVTAHRRISDVSLTIDLIGHYDRPETKGLAPLRAEEILHNAKPSWRSISSATTDQ